MTDFQELKLHEFNLILKLCFERKQRLQTICEQMPEKSESAVRKKIYQLKELELMTQDGCYYKATEPKFPTQLFAHWIDEKYQRMSAAMKNDAQGKRIKFIENKTTLGDAVYVHKMERLADKYHKQARESQKDRKSPRVWVGNMWASMI